MQIIYISNRIDIVRETLRLVETYMPFVNEAIIFGPRDFCKKATFKDGYRFEIKLVAEEDCISGAELRHLRQSDHQYRNYHLRRHLIRLDDVKAEFLMSDDDARPLRMVEISDFKYAGAYRNYFFYDLQEWPRDGLTAFDEGQDNTGVVLDYFHMPTLSYASHMPQIINKKIYMEATEKFLNQSKDFSLCEWSIYFNFAVSNHPDLFQKPEPYRTLCWPDTYISWPQYVKAKSVLFENYYPDFYKPGGPFFGLTLPDKPRDELNDAGLKKAILWRRYKHPYSKNALFSGCISLVNRLMKPVISELYSIALRLKNRNQL